MNRKKWILLLLLITATAVYLQLFYKTYRLSSVPQSADQIITIDKKRIINTLLWNTITTPSQWNLNSVFASSKKDTSWVDMINLPDYIFVFHNKDQPPNIYYTILEIASEKDFSNGLLKYHFDENKEQHLYRQYYSAESGMMLLRNGNYLLAAIIQPGEVSYILQTANEVFEKKNYQSQHIIQKTIAAASHAAYWIKQNDFLQQDAVFKANFNKEELSISGVITVAPNIHFEEAVFSLSANSLGEIGFTKPAGSAWAILPEAFKNKLSNTLACNADSVLRGNAALQLSITGIKPKIDSAISYSYDDDFNKIEKVVVNNILEPALQISIKGDSINKLYNHWKATEKLETTTAGELLVLMPFVKSYITGNTASALQITSYNFTPAAAPAQIKCLAFCNINFQKLPGDARKYLPDGINEAIKNFDKASLVVQNINGHVSLKIDVKKKQNDLPPFNF